MTAEEVTQMTEEGRSATHDDDDPWDLFEQRLAAYFSTMTDPVDEDRVMFHIPTSSPASLGKINVFTFAQGTCLQATMAGDYTTRHVSEAADLARAVRQVVERRYGFRTRTWSPSPHRVRLRPGPRSSGWQHTEGPAPAPLSMRRPSFGVGANPFMTRQRTPPTPPGPDSSCDSRRTCRR